MPAKPHLNLVFIGHVDHGKSTTVGRILYDTGNIDPHELENLKKLAEQMGKATFEFAFVMDQVKEERERGLTIDVAHKRFDTDKYYFTIIDAPGHRDFVKNMITGTSQADAAVLVVGAAEGVQTQTKEHIFLARTLGVEQLIVAINKMDAAKPPFAEARYNELKAELSTLLKGVGYKVDKVPFIPISSYKGENIVKSSSKMAWYKGPALVEALNQLTVPPKPTNLPLRLPVQDVYSITGAGTVPVGRVETGLLKVGMKVHFMPADKVGEVKSIEMHHEQIPHRQEGPSPRGRRGSHGEPADGGQVLHRADHRAEPSQRHHGRVHAGLPRPHGPGRVYLRGDHRGPGPEDGRAEAREARLPQDRRRGPREDPTDEAPRDRGLQGLPADGPLRDPGHGSDRRGGSGHRRREGEVTSRPRDPFPQVDVWPRRRGSR